MFLELGSALWVVRGQEGTPGGPGDAFHFLFTAVPVLLAFLLLDLAALGWIFFRTPRQDRLGALALWFAVVVLWCGAVAFDRHESVRDVEPRHSDVSESTVFTPFAAYGTMSE